MKYQKNIMALLLVVLFPMANAVCTPAPPPEIIEDRMTVEKTTEKFIILIETISEPSASLVRYIAIRDKITGASSLVGQMHVGHEFDGTYTRSEQGNFLRIEVDKSVLRKELRLDSYHTFKPYLTKWKVVEVKLGELEGDYVYFPKGTLKAIQKYIRRRRPIR